MPSHQERRAPLPADYQYPTHGVDCDCPPCRNKLTQPDTREVRWFHIGGEPPTVTFSEPTADSPWGV